MSLAASESSPKEGVSIFLFGMAAVHKTKHVETFDCTSVHIQCIANGSRLLTVEFLHRAAATCLDIPVATN